MTRWYRKAMYDKDGPIPIKRSKVLCGDWMLPHQRAYAASEFRKDAISRLGDLTEFPQHKILLQNLKAVLKIGGSRSSVTTDLCCKTFNMACECLLDEQLITDKRFRAVIREAFAKKK